MLPAADWRLSTTGLGASQLTIETQLLSHLVDCKSAPAAAQSAEERQAQCGLSAIRDTRSALAVQYIRSACNWLALNGDSLLNETSRGYYICLVRQLSGAQANEAAGAIISACRASNPL